MSISIIVLGFTLGRLAVVAVLRSTTNHTTGLLHAAAEDMRAYICTLRGLTITIPNKSSVFSDNTFRGHFGF